MERLPSKVEESLLWRRLESHPELQLALSDLRQVAEAVGAQAARVVPSYTDHSVVHMDALWAVTDKVFTADEIQMFTPGEAFVLGSSFYVHDLGMAYAATPEGLEQLIKSDAYVAALAKASSGKGVTPQDASVIAVQVAARDLHAKKAKKLVEEGIPGLERPLIHSPQLREQWASHIGNVSASHHWSLPAVDKELGSRGRVPDAVGGTVDLGLLACALRVIDYAHVNSERAGYLARVLRSSIDPASLVHWKAQEHITGPDRQDDRLVFGYTKPIADVEAWWLFYEMATGVDSEIHAVSDYLNGRMCSVDRFSLEGVKGIRSPQTFAALVAPENFDPVDVRFKPDSIERLVDILGGKTLYGDDSYAPIRELLQNARDAISLQKSAELALGRDDYRGRLEIGAEGTGDSFSLSITDNGVGMSPEVVTNYLLGIASDYWHSGSFFTSFPGVLGAGFKPAGKFGIGFLSVFMIGQEVEVETERRGGSHVTLTLKGVGKRGALVASPSRGYPGTTIRVKATGKDITSFLNLDSVIRARAPMVDFPIRVSLPDRVATIRSGWWQSASQEEFHDFVGQWEQSAMGNTHPEDMALPKDIPMDRYQHRLWRPRRRFEALDRLAKWPGHQPEVVSDTYRVMAIPAMGKIVLCSRGIAVNAVPMTGLVGMVQLDNLELTAARSTALSWNSSQLYVELISQLRPQISRALNELSNEESVPSRFEFLAKVANIYGHDVMLDTNLPWITLVEPPGHAKLLSPKELQQRLSQVSEIVVGYGTGPWSIVKTARKHFPNVTEGGLLIAVPSDGQPSSGSYKDEQDLTSGPLSEHFLGETSVDGAGLLVSVLKIVATAWGVDITQMTEAPWSRNKQNSLCGRLARKPPSTN